MTYDHRASTFGPTRIAELLRRAPDDANTPEKLAKVTGFSMETIDRLSKDEYEPSLHVAYKLAAALQIPLENLFEDNTNTTVEKGD